MNSLVPSPSKRRLASFSFSSDVRRVCPWPQENNVRRLVRTGGGQEAGGSKSRLWYRRTRSASTSSLAETECYATVRARYTTLTLSLTRLQNMMNPAYQKLLEHAPIYLNNSLYTSVLQHLPPQTHPGSPHSHTARPFLVSQHEAHGDPDIERAVKGASNHLCVESPPKLRRCVRDHPHSCAFRLPDAWRVGSRCIMNPFGTIVAFC